MSTPATPAENAKVKLTEPASLTGIKTGIKLSIAGHHEWRESIAGPSRDFDEIDEWIDELTICDPYECHAPSRRSDKSLASFLDMIDNLPISNDRKEPTR